MIWCVEDDASIRDIEVYTLSSTGFDARGFADGVSFWAALQTEKPDLVVLDGDILAESIDCETLRTMRYCVAEYLKRIEEREEEESDE